MANKIVYRIGVALFFLGVAAAVLYHTGIFVPTEALYPCAFRRICGLYCPGCGGTRSVEALLNGRLLTCLAYHPFVFYCFLMYVIFMITHSLERLLTFLHAHTKNKRKPPHHKRWVKGLSFRISYVYIGIIILLLQWLLKNLSLL